jgi:hypothetical protein
MNEPATTQMPRVASPLSTARTAGVLYLLNIATILVAVLLFRGIIVSGDPSASASNLVGHEARFRIAVAFELISTACSVAVAGLLYTLLKPAGRNLSLIAAFFRLLACGIALVGYGFQVAPLQILADVHHLGGLTLEQLQSLALVVYKLHGAALDMVIVFFGFHFVLIGALIIRSTLLPRALGVLVALAGAGALTLLMPALGRPLFPYFVVVGLVAEISLALWLTLRGVEVRDCSELSAV